MNGTSLQDLLREARALHNRHLVGAALEKLSEASQLVDDDPALLMETAKAYWDAGGMRESASLLERALKTVRDTPRLLEPDMLTLLLLRLGAARVRLGDLKLALRVLYEALERSDHPYSALQLGNTLRYMGNWEEAEGHLTRAFNKAKGTKDGALAIASLCAQGEMALDKGEANAAIELFGKALGLSELTYQEAVSVAPLGGLAHAHALWGYPKKAKTVGEKAYTRARQARDGAGVARALLSLGIATGEVKLLQQAEEEAANATHVPLGLRARVARLEREYLELEVREALAEARAMEMQPDAVKLAKLLEEQHE